MMLPGEGVSRFVGAGGLEALRGILERCCCYARAMRSPVLTYRMVLRACSRMLCTEGGYDATRVLGGVLYCYLTRDMVLRSCYGMLCTGWLRCYARAMECFVLISGRGYDATRVLWGALYCYGMLCTDIWYGAWGTSGRLGRGGAG
eukprot:2996683-Rhodomonas_salina.1